MKDRLLKFLVAENISATQFADDIGVQRSSVSHILAGRNNPSFDFIQKTLSRYPHLNAEWLILGKGGMFHHNEPPRKDLFTEAPSPPASVNVPPVTSDSSADIISSRNRPPSVYDAYTSAMESGNGPHSMEGADTPENTEKPFEIERIIVFYSNRTCREYRTT